MDLSVKAPEVFFTFTIETGWTKRLILERYLNIAEMGHSIFGVQAAAKIILIKMLKRFNKGQKRHKLQRACPILKKYKRKTFKRLCGKPYWCRMNNLESDPDVQLIIKYCLFRTVPTILYNYTFKYGI